MDTHTGNVVLAVTSGRVEVSVSVLVRGGRVDVEVSVTVESGRVLKLVLV